MNEFYDDIENEDNIFPRYEAECQGCDMFLPVNDLGLCEDCAGKLDRDMIRKRDWAYSVLAFGCPKDKLEDLRNDIVKKYDKRFELISDEKTKKKKQQNKSKRTRRK